ncbi:MAG: DUF190 domain-containing protein [Rubrimonas sp.]|uniref:DUF190 domain-containing protein n=1 Tax=Rubrimonas sp. TaxID=2036015 RepID=UPI002FDCCDAD
MTGICGGFTTFSVFSLESVNFLASGEHRLAAFKIGGSAAAWLLAVRAGYAIGARFNRLGGPAKPRATEERISDMRIPERAVALRIFDSEDKVEAFLPELDRLMTSGLITIENMRVLQYGKKGGDRGG